LSGGVRNNGRCPLCIAVEETTVTQTHITSQPQISPALVPTFQVGEEIWLDLMEGNHRFCVGTRALHAWTTEREFLVSGQRPKAIIIGCSDSRVPPELVFDQSLGDLFVVRAAGNVIDAIALGSVEYAVEHLGTRLVVVLGHDRCGAVQAACNGGRGESANLKAILSELKLSVEQCHRTAGAALIRDIVEANARRVADQLLTRSAVLNHQWNIGGMQVIPARYDLYTGEVIRLQQPQE
jgi:carbonic anhydrase